jgi:hypothetical protein
MGLLGSPNLFTFFGLIRVTYDQVNRGRSGL